MSQAPVTSTVRPAAAAHSASALFDRLADSDLFRAVSRSTLEPIRNALDEATLPAGGCLFAEGDPGDALYVVSEGRLLAEVRSARGEVIGVGEFEPGQCVGEMALLTGRPRTATITAQTDARLVRLPKEAFERLVDDAPELARGL